MTNNKTVLSKRATITSANEIKCTEFIGIDFQHPPPEDPGYPTAGEMVGGSTTGKGTSSPHL